MKSFLAQGVHVQPTIVLVTLVLIGLTNGLGIIEKTSGSPKQHFLSPLDEQDLPWRFQGALGIVSSWARLFESLSGTSVDQHRHGQAVFSQSAPVPLARQEMYFRPVSITLQCVMLLTIVSALLYTSLSLSRNCDELNGSFQPSVTTQTFTVASRMASTVPMLCMLMVACRMYVLATTQGLGEPEGWVKTCMEISTGGVVMQLLIVFMLPVCIKHEGQEEASYDMTEGKQALLSKQKAHANQAKLLKVVSAIEHTQATRPLVAGEKKIDVESVAGLDIDDPIVIGTDENAEMKMIGSLGAFGSVILSAPLQRDHPEGTPITKVSQGLLDSSGHILMGEELQFMHMAGGHCDAHPILHQVGFHEDFDPMKTLFYCVQLFSMLCIYGGVFGIIFGIFTFPSGISKVSPAVICTVLLGCVYFIPCLLVFTGRACNEHELTNAALAMSMSVRKAPMFAVVFLAARMRALQLDPPHGMPPWWMQACFFGITACVYVEVFCAALTGWFGRSTKAYYGVYVFHSESIGTKISLHTCALLSSVLLIPIVCGVFLTSSPAYHDVPLSTTMCCVLFLTAAYFFVACAQEVIFFLEDLHDDPEEFLVGRDASVAANVSLGLAPSLCILFVATRMRALQITQQQGDPPGWAQDCMILAVCAVCLQSVCCLVMPLFIDKACEIDDDGNPNYDLRPMIGAYAVCVVKYVAILTLHGSVIAICVSVFTMTPETAHSGSRVITSYGQFVKGVAFIAVIFFLALLLSSAKAVGLAVKFAIEAADETLLGVNITIRKVALSAWRGYVEIRDLKVEQPKFEIVYHRDHSTGEMTPVNVCESVTEQGPDGKSNTVQKRKENTWKEDYIFKIKTLLVKIDLWKLATTLGKEFVLENLSLVGIHANVETPTYKLTDERSNIEYILHHLEYHGLLPKHGKEDAKLKDDAKSKGSDATHTKPESESVDLPLITLRKIEFGDISTGVRIGGLPMNMPDISFRPKIGTIKIDDVSHDLCDGKESLPPGKLVACIVSGLTHKIFERVRDGMKERVTGIGGHLSAITSIFHHAKS